MLLDFAKMIVIRSFNRLVDLRKRDLFVRRHRNIHFLTLSLPILLMDFERNVENSFLFPIYYYCITFWNDSSEKHNG